MIIELEGLTSNYMKVAYESGIIDHLKVEYDSDISSEHQTRPTRCVIETFDFRKSQQRPHTIGSIVAMTRTYVGFTDEVMEVWDKLCANPTPDVVNNAKLPPPTTSLEQELLYFDHKNKYLGCELFQRLATESEWTQYRPNKFPYGENLLITIQPVLETALKELQGKVEDGLLKENPLYKYAIDHKSCIILLDMMSGG